ncbi:putative secreted protein [Pseudomonas aeruginosa]|nr:putative secreted protein [Pseudomonas aeruginosa]
MSIELAMTRRDLLKRSVVAGIAGMGSFVAADRKLTQ